MTTVKDSPPLHRWIVFIGLPRRAPIWKPYALAIVDQRRWYSDDLTKSADRLWLRYAIDGGDWLDKFTWKSWVEAPDWMLEPHQQAQNLQTSRSQPATRS